MHDTQSLVPALVGPLSGLRRRRHLGLRARYLGASAWLDVPPVLPKPVEAYSRLLFVEIAARSHDGEH